MFCLDKNLDLDFLLVLLVLIVSKPALGTFVACVTCLAWENLDLDKPGLVFACVALGKPGLGHNLDLDCVGQNYDNKRTKKKYNSTYPM